MTLMFIETYQTSKCMDNADLTVSNLMEYFISLKRIDTESQSELPQANSVESDLGCPLRVYFDNLMLMSHNVKLTSWKPCQYNNKFDCSETNSYNISQDAINENIYFIYSFDRIMDFNRAEPTCYRTNFP